MKFKIKETGELRELTLDDRSFNMAGDIEYDSATDEFREDDVIEIKHNSEDVTATVIGNGGAPATYNPEDDTYEVEQAVFDFWNDYARTNAADMDRLEALYDKYHEDRKLWIAMSKVIAEYLIAPGMSIETEHNAFEDAFDELRKKFGDAIAEG